MLGRLLGLAAVGFLAKAALKKAKQQKVSALGKKVEAATAVFRQTFTGGARKPARKGRMHGMGQDDFVGPMPQDSFVGPMPQDVNAWYTQGAAIPQTTGLTTAFSPDVYQFSVTNWVAPLNAFSTQVASQSPADMPASTKMAFDGITGFLGNTITLAISGAGSDFRPPQEAKQDSGGAYAINADKADVWLNEAVIPAVTNVLSQVASANPHTNFNDKTDAGLAMNMLKTIQDTAVVLKNSPDDQRYQGIQQLKTALIASSLSLGGGKSAALKGLGDDEFVGPLEQATSYPTHDPTTVPAYADQLPTHNLPTFVLPSPYSGDLSQEFQRLPNVLATVLRYNPEPLMEISNDSSLAAQASRSWDFLNDSAFYGGMAYDSSGYPLQALTPGDTSMLGLLEVLRNTARRIDDSVELTVYDKEPSTCAIGPCPPTRLLDDPQWVAQHRDELTLYIANAEGLRRALAGTLKYLGVSGTGMKGLGWLGRSRTPTIANAAAVFQALYAKESAKALARLQARSTRKGKKTVTKKHKLTGYTSSLLGGLDGL